MQPVKKILMTREGKQYFVRDTSQDFHTQFGFVAKMDLKKRSGSVKSQTGKEFFIFDPSFIDSYRKIKRGPQIITLKDLGFIIAETGIGKESKIVDAGAGSGASCCFLANIAKEVVSYENRKEFYEIATLNGESLGLKNLRVKYKDVYAGISEKNVDLVLFDLPDPWKGVDVAAKALKPGGFLVSYSPTLAQVQDFVKAVQDSGRFMYIKTAEINERTWEVEERKLRPKTAFLNHTGFMSVCRKA